MLADQLQIGPHLDYKNKECFTNIIQTIQNRIQGQAWNLLNDDGVDNANQAHAHDSLDNNSNALGNSDGVQNMKSVETPITLDP
jgi:hypothetical protein